LKNKKIQGSIHRPLQHGTGRCCALLEALSLQRFLIFSKTVFKIFKTVELVRGRQREINQRFHRD
jgi:hypothetical protein